MRLQAPPCGASVRRIISRQSEVHPRCCCWKSFGSEAARNALSGAAASPSSSLQHCPRPICCRRLRQGRAQQGWRLGGDRPFDLRHPGVAGITIVDGRQRDKQRPSDRALLRNLAQPVERRSPCHWSVSWISSRSGRASSSLSASSARYRLAIAVRRASRARSSSDCRGSLALKNLMSGALLNATAPRRLR